MAFKAGIVLFTLGTLKGSDIIFIMIVYTATARVGLNS
ncbi:hypothetical protein SALWKB2_1153 [Snodgrassella alvi wkB2]|nr:hypothetical protein SALWKB2_1153 [Snodgrassella alvi wkB2]